MPDDTCRSIVDFVPFVGLMHGATSPVVTRLMEAAIIAAVSTSIAMFAGVKVIEVELLNTKQKLGEIESSMERKIDRLEVSIERQINEMDGKIKRVDDRVEKIYRDLYAPRGMFYENNLTNSHAFFGGLCHNAKCFNTAIRPVRDAEAH